MRNWNEPKRNKAYIELIPMIDVMMFLLVFFVLISINVLPATGLKTQLPSASSAQQLKPQKKAIVTLGEQDQLQPDGSPILITDLVSTIKQPQQAGETTTIIVNSDKQVAVERQGQDVMLSTSLFYIAFTDRHISSRNVDGEYEMSNAGKIENKGIETELSGKLPHNFNYFASYTYTDSK